MLSINTNLSSLIAQRSMTQSTNSLNLTIERMTTGFKINHAKDNAANYSISTNLTTKIGSYNVAEDNCAMGLDMLSTASSALNQMSDLASKLRALTIQAQNGTYGNESLNAIQTEADALISNVKTIFGRTEYNGIKLLNSLSEKLIAGDSSTPQTSPSGNIPKPTYSGFIENPKDYTDTEVAAMTALSSMSSSSVITSGQYSITSLAEFEQFAEMSRSAKIKGGEFVLGTDIDLSSYSTGEGFTPIAFGISSSGDFNCDFNGNGHTISNLYINRPDANNIGLFSIMCDVKNLCLKNVDITGAEATGALIGDAFWNSPEIINCCILSGTVKGTKKVGGLVGDFSANGSGKLLNCYSNANVTGDENVGGLLGFLYLTSSTITNCFVKGNVLATSKYAGGFVGSSEDGSFENCYTEGIITGTEYVGGFSGKALYIKTKNCFAKGEASGTNYVGGFTGTAGTHTGISTIENCYADVEVFGNMYVGGFIGAATGQLGCNINNCYAKGDVLGSTSTGGLIGYLSSECSLFNSYATGCVKGNNNVAALIGYVPGAKEIKNCYATGDVIATGSFVGGIVGRGEYIHTLSDCYYSGNVSGQESVGGLVGLCKASNIINCSSDGNVLGDLNIGGLVGKFYDYGSISVNNCVSMANTSGNSSSGSFVGYLDCRGSTTFTNCKTSSLDIETIGGKSTSVSNDILQNLLTGIEIVNIERVDPTKLKITLQVGVGADTNSNITFNTSFSAEVIDALLEIDILSSSALQALDSFMDEVNQKQVEYGAVQNRLESVLEEIVISRDNLISSRSTLRDANIAEVSSEYIRQQILQQASATLLATANQSPAIALQLI